MSAPPTPIDMVRVALMRAWIHEQNSEWRARREQLDEAMRLVLEEAMIVPPTMDKILSLYREKVAELEAALGVLPVPLGMASEAAASTRLDGETFTVDPLEEARQAVIRKARAWLEAHAGEGGAAAVEQAEIALAASIADLDMVDL